MTRERVLPGDVEASGQTPLFTNETVPDKILTHHELQAGTWGLLTVEAGNGELLPNRRGCAGCGHSHRKRRLVILPEEVHYVRLSEDAEFFVTFYKRPKN